MRLILLATFMFSPWAWSTPEVNDLSHFNTTLVGPRASYTGVDEWKIVGHDNVRDLFLVDTQIMGRSRVKWVSRNSLYTEQALDDLIDNCTKFSSFQSRLETIDVPAGSFDTCAIPIDPRNPARGDKWIAKGVPFGVVKIEDHDPYGNVLTLELSDFTLGGEDAAP